MRIMRSLAVIVTASVATATFAVPSTAFADEITTTDQVVAAIDNVDARTNLVLDAVQSSAVTVPNDPKQGVQLALPGGQKMTVGLPNAKQGGKGIKTRKGATTYLGKNGSANAVIPTTDGVQLLTTIRSRTAPLQYDYPVTLPQGGKIEVAQQNGGGAVVYDAKGKLTAVVPAPWAKDVSGKDVRTGFTTDGKTLTQYVDHKTRGVQYPVVADPVVVWLPLVIGWCAIAGSYEARNLRGQPWYIWLWGLTLACVPL